MKVAITAQGPSLDSPVDPRFGRAKHFIVLDIDTNEFTVHDNTQNLQAVQGAGIQAGSQVVALGVDAVITGNVGPKAYRTLQAGHVQLHPGASGTVREAIAEFKAGRLPAADGANVDGHWV